ncbi:MAG: biopolymer transport protein ExbD [Pirellulaceae bacterium]|jgi:biopolymer transport protein ExbD
MTSLIDIVFLLIVFFMTVSQISEIKRAKLDLPKLKTDGEQHQAELTINLDKKGTIMVGGGDLTIAQFHNLVQTEYANSNNTMASVVIRADENCDSAFINQVVTTLGRVGIQYIRVAVEDP